MTNFPSHIFSLTEWSRIQIEHDDISVPVMSDQVKRYILQVAIKRDPMMVTTFSNYKQLHAIQNLPAEITCQDLF